MREILFRGKRIEDGEWVYGYVAIHTIIGEETELKTVIVQKPDKIYQCDSWIVDPETVGQYTGLLDKNGKKIFEGDVVVDRWANEYTPVFQNGIYMAYNPKHLTQNGPSTQFNVIWKDGCEIIGNIHEGVQE